MKILQKTLIILVITTLLFVGATYVLMDNVVMKGFLENELIWVQQEMDKIAHAIRMKFESIERILVDWSAWDETYQFVVDKNEEYIRSNLLDETFINLDINLMVFVDSSNNIVFAKALDLYTQGSMKIPNPLLDEIRSGGSPLLMGNGTSGLILTDDGPLMISSKPILKSNEEGPPRGFLIFGRYLDEKVLGWIEDLTKVKVSAHVINDSSPASNVGVVPVKESLVVGSFVMTDIHGRPILSVHGEFPRIMYQHGKNAVTLHLNACFVLYFAWRHHTCTHEFFHIFKNKQTGGLCSKYRWRGRS